jgi:acyl dehydratase
VPTAIEGIEGLRDKIGVHLGYSDWHTVTQDQVDRFADATGDHQWIHVDVERAKRESPFGGPIAHGYLTLSLTPSLLPEIVTVSGVKLAVNYGCNRLRFPTPVPVGSRLRLGAKLNSLEDVPGGVQAIVEATYEVEGQEKPSCVAEIIFRYYA